MCATLPDCASFSFQFFSANVIAFVHTENVENQTWLEHECQGRNIHNIIQSATISIPISWSMTRFVKKKHLYLARATGVRLIIVINNKRTQQVMQQAVVNMTWSRCGSRNFFLPETSFVRDFEKIYETKKLIKIKKSWIKIRGGGSGKKSLCCPPPQTPRGYGGYRWVKMYVKKKNPNNVETSFTLR